MAACALVLAGCGGDSKPVLQSAAVVRNGDLTPGLPIRYEDPTHPRLAQLRQQEQLDNLLSPSGNEFQTILAVKDWVAAQWPHSTPDPYPPWDAIDVLEWIRSGRTGGFCGQYSQVMLQSLASLGLTARYVEIGSFDSPQAHFVVEVWSNDFDKWVMMDADFNVHFVRGGIPLSTLEIHEALINGTTDQVDAVLGPTRDGHDDPHIYPLRTMEFYYYLRMVLRGDHLSNTIDPNLDRYNDSVEWAGDEVVPWEQSTVFSTVAKERIANLSTSDRVDYSAKLNQVRVTVKSVVEGDVYLQFETNIRDFRDYRIVEYDSSNGQITRSWSGWLTHDFVWRPINKGRWIEVRAYDVRGIRGPSAEVSATFGRR